MWPIKTYQENNRNPTEKELGQSELPVKSKKTVFFYDRPYLHLDFYLFHNKYKKEHSRAICYGTLPSNFVNHLTTRVNSLSNVYTLLYSETAWIEGSNIFGNNFQIFCVWDGLTVIVDPNLVCKQFCSVQEMVWLRSSCGRKWIVAHACIWPLLTTIYL